MTGNYTLVRNGLIVLPEYTLRADVLIEDGVISAIGHDLKGPQGTDRIDASNYLVFPGVVDEHVHMREPGLTHKSDFTHGTMSAAAGGVTTVLEMPNTIPPVEDAGKLIEKRDLLQPKAYVDFGLYGVLHDRNPDKFEEMVEAGAVGFKIFLGPTTGNIPPPPDGTLYELLLKSAKYSVPLAFHAENNELVKYFTNKVKSTGRTDPAAHTDARPRICEVEAVQRIIAYAEETRGIALIVHMSASKGVKLVKYAKESGVKVYAETNPHYLLLSVDDYGKYGNLIKVNPPIRDRGNQAELWRLLNEGAITHLGSDHAPHTPEDKSGDVWTSSAGFPGVQTLFPLMLDAALKGMISLNKLPELLSRNPAKLFGIYPRKGGISVGSDGDLVIVDPNSQVTIFKDSLYYKFPQVPYVGWTLKGKIKYTLLRGIIVAEEGKVVNGPKGTWIRP